MKKFKKRVKSKSEFKILKVKVENKSTNVFKKKK